MNTSTNNPIWVIKCEKTGKYFSLLGSPHFTDNVEIAQRFDSEEQAILCEEEHIFNNLDLLEYDSLPMVLLPVAVTNEPEAKQVIDYLMSVLGGGFHPDTPIADYVKTHTNEQTFTEAEISLLQPLLDQCFGVMGDEVYNYAMEVYCSNEANLDNELTDERVIEWANKQIKTLEIAATGFGFNAIQAKLKLTEIKKLSQSELIEVGRLNIKTQLS